MKKNKYGLLAIAITLVMLASCTKWLDVKPEDQFVEEELLKTEQGFIDAMNGLYIGISSDGLYGSKLTMRNMDILAHLYYISISHSESWNALSNFNYAQQGVLDDIDATWSDMYSNIANVNNFIAALGTYGGVLDANVKGIFTGEAHAMRAILYFDLMRMFSPAYTVDSTAAVIPYYERVTNDIASFSPSNEVMAKILADLDTAETWLKQYDPVISLDKVDQTMYEVETGSRPFMTFRNYRLNYYAVKGFQARVNSWKGDKPAALAAAKSVIAAQSKFPWITQPEVTSSSYPNRVFSTELLFALDKRNLYDLYDTYFSPSLTDDQILSAGLNNTFLNQVFESQATDFRYGPMWNIEGGKTYPVFLKYKDVSSTAWPNYRYTVPMLRLSEVFLIAAECEPDPQKALDYLNELKTNRNAPLIADPALLGDGILSEYRKEFIGEGQLWYYYKRTQTTHIIAASSSAGIGIEAEDYVFPIPYSETDPR